MTTGWTAKTLERSRRLNFFITTGGLYLGGGVGAVGGQWGRGGVQAPFTGEPIHASVLELAVLSAWGWNLGAQLGVALGLQDGDQSGHPASRDWILDPIWTKSLVQTVFQRGLEKASWEAAAE